VPVILHLVMGWLIPSDLDPIIAALRPLSLRLLVARGLFYMAGVVFYALDYWWHWCHGVWHRFVLAGSISHYFAILLSL
jgi:hemolysin III